MKYWVNPTVFPDSFSAQCPAILGQSLETLPGVCMCVDKIWGWVPGVPGQPEVGWKW